MLFVVTMGKSNLNEEQQQAVTHGTGPLLIIAGAGTGKTTVITQRIKYLIENGVAPEKILALTFTERASKEMEDRIYEALPYGYTQLWISTFHSFCDQVLRKEAMHIGLDPSYKLTTQSEIVLFVRKNIFKFDLDYFRPLGNPTKFIDSMLKHFDRLRDEDIQPEEYLKYAQSLSKNDDTDDEEIKKTLELATAFKTFEELKIQEGLMDFPNLLSATLKLFRERKNILKQYQNKFEYILIDEFQDTNYAQNELAVMLAGDKRNITVVGDDDQCLVPDTVITVKDGKKTIKEVTQGEEVLTAVGNGCLGFSKVSKVFKNKKKTTLFTFTTGTGKKIVATGNHKMFYYSPGHLKVHLALQKSKNQPTNFSFMESKGIEEFKNNADNYTLESRLAIGKLGNKVLPSQISEASNLGVGQYLPVITGEEVIYDEIISISREDKQEWVYDLEIEKTHNFIANGIVVHNSIYRWRGAAISNILQFRKIYPEVKIVTLTKNYRSSRTVLDTSYNLIQHNNPDRLEIKENVSKKLEAMRSVEGDNIEFLFADKVENEAEQVAKKIIELTKNKKNLKFSDIAILVRANDHAMPFVREFDRQGIPHQFLGPGNLFVQEEIKDLVAYLKVLYNFEDSTALYRVLCMDHFAFDPRDIAMLLNYAKRNNYTLFEALEKVGSTTLSHLSKEKVQLFVDMIKKHLALVPKETAGFILFTFLQDSGLLQSLSNETSEETERKAKNIAKLFDRLKSFEAEYPDASIFTTVDWIDLAMQMGESSVTDEIGWEDNNAVNILTIHASKGLEFPVVFLVNLVSQRFPTREQAEAIPVPEQLIKEILPEGNYHLQEERRLFYVGMTRAKDNLILTAAKLYGDAKREKKVSPFVYETLGIEKVEHVLNNKEKVSQLSLFDLMTQQNLIPVSSSIENIKRTPITYLSYSQLQTFDMCPLHYKLRYLLKVPTVAKAAAPSFGTTIHAALQRFYQSILDGNSFKPEDILLFLDQVWSSQGYDSKEQEKLYYQKAKTILLDYVTQYFDSKKLPLLLETPFTFNLNKGDGWLKVAGRIDRVDQTQDGRIEIIDYKTGNNVPTEKELLKNLQLTIYALAATKIRGTIFNRQPEEVILTLHYLEQNKKLTTTRTKEQLQQAEQEILEKVRQIETSDFNCSRNFFCGQCEYNMLCSTTSNGTHSK